MYAIQIAIARRPQGWVTSSTWGRGACRRAASEYRARPEQQASSGRLRAGLRSEEVLSIALTLRPGTGWVPMHCAVLKAGCRSTRGGGASPTRWNGKSRRKYESELVRLF